MRNKVQSPKSKVQSPKSKTEDRKLKSEDRNIRNQKSEILNLESETENQESGVKTIFIDRDGTLIEEVNFLSRTEDLRFFPYTDEAVKLLKDNGYLVIVVTNQSGIGRKYFTESAMHEIHEKIQEELTEKLDGFYFCPHLPADGCDCRKPKLGMIETACAHFPIDLENSWMIGDKILDIELGINAGIKTALVLTGYGKKHLSELPRKPDIIAENLLEAAVKITNYELRMRLIQDS